MCFFFSDLHEDVRCRDNEGSDIPNTYTLDITIATHYMFSCQSIFHPQIDGLYPSLNRTIINTERAGISFTQNRTNCTDANLGFNTTCDHVVISLNGSAVPNNSIIGIYRVYVSVMLRLFPLRINVRIRGKSVIRSYSNALYYHLS